jgi:hypothetical protein
MSRGQFFTIDRRTWGVLCCGNDLNAAVSYLVLASGTSADNRGTSWSVESLKTHAGISFERGKGAIKTLCDWGLIRHAETFTPTRPRYEILSHAEVSAFRRPSLEHYQRTVLDNIRAGRQPPWGKRSPERRTAEELVHVGKVRKNLNGVFEAVPEPSPEPELIYLPNQLATGTDKGEDSPVRRLRAGGDIWALRLLVDLYDAHNLRDDGGISPKVLSEKYTRREVGYKGIYTIWAFSCETQWIRWTGPFAAHEKRPKPNEEAEHPAWETLRALQRHGLLSFVPHLWTNDPTKDATSDAEIIHPYGFRNVSAAEKEVQLAEAAHEAALSMLPDFRADQAAGCHLAPIAKNLPNVQLVGVPRLLYRPKTKRTSDWYGELNSNADKWIARYQDEIRAGNTRRAHAHEQAS